LQLIGIGEIEGTPILSVNEAEGSATLETIAEAMARLDGHRDYQPLLQMNLGAGLLNFIELVKHERIEHSSINSPQLSAIAGVGPGAIHQWFEKEILVPDGLCSTRRERRVSFTTAFACGTCGALHRHRVGIAAMVAVANLIRRVGLPKREKVTA
jgi:hypothetical protein